MPEPSYVAKYVRDQLPVLKVIGDLLPIWRHLMLRPITFFAVLRDSNNLSIRNSITFCISSATFQTALLISIDNVSKIIVKYFLYREDYKDIDVLTSVFINGSIFLTLIGGAAIATFTTYIPAIIIKRDVSFRRVLVGAIYINTFISTISFCIVTLAYAQLTVEEFKGGYGGITGLREFIVDINIRIAYWDKMPTWSRMYISWSWLVFFFIYTKIASVMTGIKFWKMLIVEIGLHIFVSTIIALAYVFIVHPFL
jgi:hypothetical protein